MVLLKWCYRKNVIKNSSYLTNNIKEANKMRDVVIASAVRTPIGNFGGSLKTVALLVHDAEPMLLIHDQQAQIFEGHALLRR